LLKKLVMNFVGIIADFFALTIPGIKPFAWFVIGGTVSFAWVQACVLKFALVFIGAEKTRGAVRVFVAVVLAFSQLSSTTNIVVLAFSTTNDRKRTVRERKCVLFTSCTQHLIWI